MNAPAMENTPCIASLRIQYDGKFGENEIPSDKLRVPLNNTCRAIDGIVAISKILYANETERGATDGKGDLLDQSTVYGLHEALASLAANATFDAVNLGQELFDLAKGAK